MLVKDSTPSPWGETLAAGAGIKPPRALINDVSRCQTLILLNGDRETLGGFVIYKLQEDRAQRCIGKVMEILIESNTGRIIGSLMKKCTVGGDVLPYKVPRCTVTDEQILVTFSVSENQTLCGLSSCHVRSILILLDL